MCENEKKPELESEPCYVKIELCIRSRNYAHENQEFRSWSGAMFMKRRSPGHEQCHL